MNELIALNEHTRLNLLVILAACEGIWGLQMVQPVERAAHRALIGPCRRVSSREVLTGSVTFYRTMFRDRSAVTAFRAMNDAIDPARKAFNVVTAEAAFQRVYTEYLRERCSERALAEREEAIVAGLGELTERARGSSAEELGRARRLVREHLRSHRHHFNQIRTKFFFIDLYPENDARFPLRFEDFGAAVDPPDTDAAPIDSA
jgi:hypothetical protein